MVDFCTDRFNGLSDDIICHILSFIPTTKTSAQTSVLAKRWRFLWTKVPFLDFKFLTHPGVTGHSKIMDRALLQENTNIHTFRLFYADYDSNDAQFGSWIANVIARNVRNLVIRQQNQLKLPPCLFTCKTVVDLTLSGCGDIPKCGTVYFPALKRLQLNYIDYESNESLPHLLSGCPVLEELNLDVIECVDWCISLPTLTRLDFFLNEKNSHLPYYKNEKRSKVKLDTPAIRYLRLCLHTSEKILSGTLDSLIETDVSIYRKRSFEGNYLYEHSLIDFLGMLYNVKCLILRIIFPMEVPDSWFYDLLYSVDWRLTISLLQNANNLRVLTVSSISGDNYYSQRWKEPKQVPGCLISHLETINILDMTWFKGYEFHVTKYMLKNAKVLKRMKIDLQSYLLNCNQNFEALDRLSLLERGSPTCRIVFEGAHLSKEKGNTKKKRVWITI